MHTSSTEKMPITQEEARRITDELVQRIYVSFRARGTVYILSCAQVIVSFSGCFAARRI